jgi:hypothetical protein
VSDNAKSLTVNVRVALTFADNSSMTITSEASTDSIATISTKPFRDGSIFFMMAISLMRLLCFVMMPRIM